MDNGAFTGSPSEVDRAIDKLSTVFAPYKFEVQQIASNCESVQNQSR